MTEVLIFFACLAIYALVGIFTNYSIKHALVQKDFRKNLKEYAHRTPNHWEIKEKKFNEAELELWRHKKAWEYTDKEQIADMILGSTAAFFWPIGAPVAICYFGYHRIASFLPKVIVLSAAERKIAKLEAKVETEKQKDC